MNFRAEEEDRTKVWMISRRAGPQQLYSNLHAEIVAGAVPVLPSTGKGQDLPATGISAQWEVTGGGSCSQM